MGTDLMAQLSMEDQHKVDELTDKIRLLTKESKEVLRERIKLESEKNRQGFLAHLWSEFSLFSFHSSLPFCDFKYFEINNDWYEHWL